MKYENSWIIIQNNSIKFQGQTTQIYFEIDNYFHLDNFDIIFHSDGDRFACDTNAIS